VVVALTAVSLVALLWWRGNSIANQVNQITEQLGIQLQRLWDQLQASSWGPVLGQQISAASKSARAGLTGYVPGVVSSVFGAGGSIVVIAVTAVFLAASPRIYLNGGLRLLPRSWRSRGRQVACQIGTTLQLWFLGQLADMIVVAILVGIGLTFLGVPLAPTLALLAGLFNFIPYVGALAGAVPAVLVALAQGPTLAMWVALLFLCIQILEGNLIAPLIQRKTISMAPALTIVAQTVLGALFGIFGLVVATPLTAAAVTAVRMVYIESFLENDERGASV
jgi:predicted PurR-regulated permease PerM